MLRLHEATVKKNSDPEQKGRIYVQAPGLGGTNVLGPIRVLQMGGGIFTPQPGDTVLLLGEANNYYCIGIVQQATPVDTSKAYLDGTVLGVDALVRWGDLKKILDWLMKQFDPAAVPGHTHLCAAPGAPTTATIAEASSIADQPLRLTEIAQGLPATRKAVAT
jgi:hypothetical protein